MSKQAFENLGATRGPSVSFIDPHKVLIIGRDTKHRSKAEHPLWQQRALNAHEEDIVLEMMEIGVRTPIEVVRDGEDAICFDGRQRLINAREANRRLVIAKREPLRVPFLVKKVDEIQATLIGVVLNEHRIESDVLTKAADAQQMLDMGIPLERVARSFRVDKQTIESWTSLLDLDSKVKSALLGGKIGVTASVRIAKLSREEQVNALEELLASGDTSIAAADNVVRMHRARKGQQVATYQLPSKSHLKRILKLLKNDDEDAKELPEEFVAAIRWILGDLNPRSVKGLSACMDFLTAPKEPKESKAADASDDADDEEESEVQQDEGRPSGEFDHSDQAEEEAPKKRQRNA